MVDRYYQTKNTVLLTGAGFSKTFGGYLASEMWSIIFNQLSSADSDRIRALLRSELNYERAYDLAISGGDLSPAEKTVFTNALYIQVALEACRPWRKGRMATPHSCAILRDDSKGRPPDKHGQTTGKEEESGGFGSGRRCRCRDEGERAERYLFSNGNCSGDRCTHLINIE